MTATHKALGRRKALAFLIGASCALAGRPGLAWAEVEGEPLRVCATVPDLGTLASEIGGSEVDVTVFAKPTEDAHFVEAKPGFVKALNRADLFILMGLELEAGYAPTLVRNARNPRVLPGGPGYVETGAVIRPLEIPTGVIDRSMGDVHPSGNPHFLHDPLNGLRVAERLRDKLSDLRPAKKALFSERYRAFRARLGEALLGKALAEKYADEFEKLGLLHGHGKLLDYLRRQGEEGLLGGWLGAIAPFAGVKVVADHNQWPYFAARFDLRLVGFLEPKPGIAPTTKHLSELVELMRREGARAILASPYYDPRHARFLADKTGGVLVEMAHQVGSRPGTEDYIQMVDHNVRQVVAALKSQK